MARNSDVVWFVIETATIPTGAKAALTKISALAEETKKANEAVKAAILPLLDAPDAGHVWAISTKFGRVSVAQVPEKVEKAGRTIALKQPAKGGLRMKRA